MFRFRRGGDGAQLRLVTVPRTITSAERDISSMDKGRNCVARTCNAHTTPKQTHNTQRTRNGTTSAEAFQKTGGVLREQ